MATNLMFNIGGQPRPASYVAGQIHIVWVRDASTEFFNPNELHIPAKYHRCFAEKIFLYCEASALRVLLTEKQRDTWYEELVREFENLLFGVVPTAEAAAKLSEIKSAMGDLDKLIHGEARLSWCRQWLKTIGHDETNPGALGTLAQLLALNTNSLRDAIRDIGPPSAINS